VDTRKEFVSRALSGRFSVTELCAAYGVSEKTGHKWLSRFRKAGEPGLADRSHVAHTLPHRVPLDIRREIVMLRQKHPTWGPRKLRAVLARRAPRTNWPAPSTIGELLRGEGLVQSKRRKKQSIGLPLDAGLTVAKEPNEVWSTDFKGEFRLGTGPYCYPLTVLDAESRFLIGTTALASTATVPAQIAFERHFAEFGLPLVIRSDNGTPFASARSIGRLSALSVWWIRLGIRPERIQPAHPQQNGQHERMHKTLKAEATRPSSQSFFEQQQRFDRFRYEYNNLRPHEALDQSPPASRYTKSPRQFPSRLPDVTYPLHCDVRAVGGNGMTCFKGKTFFLSTALNNCEIGFEETDDDLWTLSYGPLSLGTYHPRSNIFIEDVHWNPRQENE
jgi:transposase InsO family protein